MTERWTTEEIQRVTAVIVSDVEAGQPATVAEALDIARRSCSDFSTRNKQVIAANGCGEDDFYNFDLQLTFLDEGGVPVYA